MVGTRSSALSAAPRDDNRMIVIVTGANSGFGLGICHQLLSNLSLPPGTPLPASTPQRSALPPSKQYLCDTDPGPSKHVPTSPPPTLTLILACRSKSKAEEAIEIVSKRHEKELQARADAGMPTREGWKDGLRIVWEPVDLDAVGGPLGVLSFCERVKQNYPHITTMFLNAGMAVHRKNHYFQMTYQVLTQGLCRPLTYGTFTDENPGVMSADGERGMVWGVNVLAPYILSKELAPLLRQSTDTLPFPPRIIYTSSCTAEYSSLKPNPLEDYQLLSYGYPDNSSVYKASKYCGDLVMIQLDRQFAKAASEGEREIRVFTADPGVVATNIAGSTFGPWVFYRKFMQFMNFLIFFLVRLAGSPFHPVYATEGALPMLYAALIGSEYVQPADKVPAQKFRVHATRWGSTTVDYGEVDQWESTLDLGRDMTRACEAVRLTYRRSEGLE